MYGLVSRGSPRAMTHATQPHDDCKGRARRPRRSGSSQLPEHRRATATNSRAGLTTEGTRTTFRVRTMATADYDDSRDDEDGDNSRNDADIMDSWWFTYCLVHLRVWAATTPTTWTQLVVHLLPDSLGYGLQPHPVKLIWYHSKVLLRSSRDDAARLPRKPKGARAYHDARLFQAFDFGLCFSGNNWSSGTHGGVWSDSQQHVL